MENNKGFIVPLLIVIVAVLVIGGGVYIYTSKNTSDSSIITPSDNIVGGDKDAHGCLGSAGYSWCEIKNKCLRVWEEKCEVATFDENIPLLGYITTSQVGPFQIGDLVPDSTLLSQAGYSVQETTIFPEGMPQEQFIVSKENKNLLTLDMFPDLKEIWDIRVTSPEFKTKEGMGVGSTISDFIKAYPNYKFWYTEEEGEKFILNISSDQKSPQFFLDRSDLLNPNKSFYPTRAIISDFKVNAKIVSVRVYFSL